jgi:putative membrane protein
MLGKKRTNLTDSTPTRNQRLTDGVLWAIVGAYLIGSRIIPGFITPLLFPFALVHGARRYGWKSIAVFMVITLIVSNTLENSSILTGFPFGHYYYTDSLGPKIALVPFFISLSYISFGYLAWVFSTILVGEVRRNSTILTTVAVSLVASFVMVDWDFSLDPIASTINHAWIWTQGGGYFGVPISNFLGWSFTVWIFFQLFALYQRGRASEDLSRALPTTHYLQSIIVYFWTGFGFVLGYLLRPTNTAISDAVGHVWQTGDIYETMAISAIYTMIFISILALVLLYRDQLQKK